MTRDRDVTELVSSRLDEEMAGGSRNTTWGAAGGIGGGFIGTGFGIFAGVAGGGSGSNSIGMAGLGPPLLGGLDAAAPRPDLAARVVDEERAIHGRADRRPRRGLPGRDRGGGQLQPLSRHHDRVLRGAPPLPRHPRAGRRPGVPLRPVPDRRVRPGQGAALAGDAGRAVCATTGSARASTPSSASPTTGWDGTSPTRAYAEEAPEILEGELRISFLLPRPRDAADGAFQVDTWAPLAPFLDIDALELFTAKLNGLNARNRDRVVPRGGRPRHRRDARAAAAVGPGHVPTAARPRCRSTPPSSPATPRASRCTSA